jgi:hypothetical protein
LVLLPRLCRTCTQLNVWPRPWATRIFLSAQPYQT